MPDPVYKLGKLPKQDDDRNLMLARYLTPAAPTPPAAVDYASAVKAWGMLGNDTVGDCAFAGQAHADMLWAANAEHRQLAITTAMVLARLLGRHRLRSPRRRPRRQPDRPRHRLCSTPSSSGASAASTARRSRPSSRSTPSRSRTPSSAIDLFGCLYVGVELPDAVLPSGPASFRPGR